MSMLQQDLQYGLRTLRKNLSFTIIVILTLALGIGANTAIFSVLNAVLLKVLPVRNPQQLVFVESVDPHGGSDGFSYATFERFRDNNTVFSGIFASTIPQGISIAINGQSELVNGQIVSGSYYSTLGVNAFIGRAITLHDDESGAQSVAMISYDYWKRRFRSDPGIVGKSISINGTVFTVIGVTPRRFFGLLVGYSPDVTIPLMMQSALTGGAPVQKDKSTWVVETIGGRLRPGVTQEQARTDLDLLFRQTLLPTQQADRFKFVVVPGGRGLSGIREQFSRPLVILMAIVALVLLVACANVANLLLARATARHEEMSLRLALGATRYRLIRQLLTENIVLAIFGGALGLLFATWIMHVLLTLIASGPFPIVIQAHLDYQSLVFTSVVTLVTAILFGLVPAFRAIDVSLIPSLKTGHGRVHKTRHVVEFGKALVVSQVAVSFLLLIGVGLFVRTLQMLKNQYPGFNPENVLTFTVEPALVGYDGPRLSNLYRELLESVESIPGVRIASASRFAQLTPGRADVKILVPGSVLPSGSRTVQENLVGPNFFRAMEMSLVLGRDFTIQDTQNAPKVVALNEAAATRYFGNVNPVGRNIELTENGTPMQFQIIGVVKNAKYHSLREDFSPMVFVPFFQMAPESTPRLTFEIRTTVPTGIMIAVVRQRLQEINRNLPIADVKTLRIRLDQSLIQERLVAALSSIFALLASVLACVGLYGLMAYWVAQRTNEIGIRMALGAQKGDVLRLILMQGMIPVLIGVGLGVVAALGLTRFLSNSLYGVSSTDPLTFLLVPVVLSAVALLACFVPAFRATKVDPIASLRYE